MGELDSMGCAGLVGVAAELALGALTGQERAAALAHLDQCEACREKVRRLMMASDELLRLLPEGESPPGFETRVLERLGLSASGGGTTRRAGQGSRRFRGRRGRRPGPSRRILAVTAGAIGAAVAVLRAAGPPASAGGPSPRMYTGPGGGWIEVRAASSGRRPFRSSASFPALFIAEAQSVSRWIATEICHLFTVGGNPTGWAARTQGCLRRSMLPPGSVPPGMTVERRSL